ncbi:hypothetical protein ACROYT_G012319 [Oculina patagonica]
MTNIREESQGKDQEITDLRSSLANIQEQSQEKDQQITDLRSRLADTQEQSQGKHQQITDLRRRLAITQEQSLEKGQEITDLQSNLANIQEQSQEKDQKITDLQSRLDTIQEQSQGKDQQITDLQSRLDTIQEQSQEKDQKITDLQTRLANIQEQSQEKDQEITDLRSSLATTQEQSQKKDQQITDLQSRLANIQEQSQQKDQKNTDLRSHLADIQEQSQGKDQQITDLESHLANIQEQSQGKDQQITGLESRLANIQEQSQGKDQQITDLESRLANIQEQSQEKDQQITDLRSHLANIQGQSQEKDQQITDLRRLLTGVVIDCGHGSTHFSPVYEGFLLPDFTRKLDIGGRDITNYLKELLLHRGQVVDFEKARLIKEKLCYVGYNIEEEKKLASETTVLMEEYILPDGQVVRLGCERFGAPEALFQPNLIEIDKVGVAEMLFNTVQATDIDTRAEYYKHIVLCGGSTLFPGFSNRIEREIKQLYCERVLNGDTSKLSKFILRIDDSTDLRHSVFFGGSVWADIFKDKEKYWMTKQEYEEKGINVLEKLGIKVRGKKEYFDETDSGHLDYADGKPTTREKLRQTIDLRVTDKSSYFAITEFSNGPFYSSLLSDQAFDQKRGVFFDANYDMCYCNECHAARGDKLYYTRGKPAKVYGIPIGWCRFGLKVQPRAIALNVFDKWHVAFHGTRMDSINAILECGDLLIPGDVALGGRQLSEKIGHFNDERKPTGFDTKQIFVSPSVRYAGHDAYAQPTSFEDPSSKKKFAARTVLQLCINPDSYTVGPQTIGATTEIDPHFSNEELEWSTKQRGAIILYGLLVKLDECK